jgi:polyhydroxyalkanoate synthase
LSSAAGSSDTSSSSAGGSAGASAAAFADLAVRVAETLSRLRQTREVKVGCSAKRPVWSCGKTTLYHYLPLPGAARPRQDTVRPVLVCFALVNRPYILDLQPDRSLVRRLLESGLDVYLIDWGDPDDGDRRTGLEEYIEAHLGGAVGHILAGHERSSLDLLGVCQGGVLSLVYSALHPGQVAKLVTLTTPVDFHTADNLLSKWVRQLDTSLIEASGNVPGQVLNSLFLALMPFRLTQQKYVRLLTGNSDTRSLEDFVRMEKWIFDSPPQAATALAQFVRWFYQENRLLRGTLEIAGHRVRLGEVRQPLLNLYARDDHIVPASASAPLGNHVGSHDYSAEEIPTGHIGMYVSRAAHAAVPGRIVSWLSGRS